MAPCEISFEHPTGKRSLRFNQKQLCDSQPAPSSHTPKPLPTPPPLFRCRLKTGTTRLRRGAWFLFSRGSWIRAFLEGDEHNVLHWLGFPLTIFFCFFVPRFLGLIKSSTGSGGFPLAHPKACFGVSGGDHGATRQIGTT